MNTRLEIAARLFWAIAAKENGTSEEIAHRAFEQADLLIAEEQRTRPPEIYAGVDGECIRVRITSEEYELIRRVKDPVRALEFLQSRGMLKAVDEPEVKS